MSSADLYFLKVPHPLMDALSDILPPLCGTKNAFRYPFRCPRITKVDKNIVFYIQQIIFCRFGKYYISHAPLSSFSVFLSLHQAYWFCLPALLYGLHQSIYIIPTLQYLMFLLLPAFSPPTYNHTLSFHI